MVWAKFQFPPINLWVMPTLRSKPSNIKKSSKEILPRRLRVTGLYKARQLG